MISSKQLADIVNKQENITRLQTERERYEIYHGALREYVKKSIEREFILQETVKQLINRIIPINITQKIVNALAKVYMSQPQRTPVNELNKDQDALNVLVQSFEMNTRMVDANRYFKLSKHFCLEPFVNLGKPQLRVLAAHNYTPVSDDSIDPTNATYIVKHLTWGRSKSEQRHVVWSDFEHYVMDGEGVIIPNELNPEGINPYGILPIVYERSQKDELIPIEDDDLIYMQIAICLLLTDLAFATKYQAWSLIYIANMKSQNISFNPNSVIFLPENKGGTEPKIGTISPTLKTQDMLMQVETLVGMLLSTKSLKASGMSALSVDNATSGISKALDSASSMEDRTEQQSYFIEAEKKLFEIVKKQLPVWNQAGLLEGKYANLSLTDDFELSIRFPTPKPLQSEKETVEVETMKINEGFTTRERALAVVNSDLSDEQLVELEIQIEKEKKLNQPAPIVESTEDQQLDDDGQATDD
jgi:hypothetical protein